MTALTGSSSKVSAAEISKQIKSLIKEVPEVRADAARLDELRRLFSRLEASGELKFGTAPPENPVAAKWRSFLLKYHKVMVSQLCDRVTLGRHAAIRCLWGVIAASPLTSENGMYKYVNADLLQKWLRAMTLQEADDMDKSMRHMVESEFIHPYRDVQYYALGSITQLAAAEYEKQNETSSSKAAEKLLELLMMIPIPTSHEDVENCQFLCPPPKDAVPDAVNDEGGDQESDSGGEDEASDDSEVDSDEEENDDGKSRPAKRQKREVHKFAFQQLRLFRREYQKAWLAVLKLSLPITSLKRALQYLPTNVLGNVPIPLRFADFFMQAYSDHGSGVVGVLALDGLFLLITQYELEYPDFYKQLYRLVSPRVLYAKYRARFFSLLTKCLVRNEMLPAHLVAAFTKRLCRSALSGPPTGALFVLALVSNLLRKHPECACLIHRQGEDEIEDKFLPNENDPVASRALQSSLWELAVYERHYHPAVATLAKSIGCSEELKAPPHDIDAFASHTYKSLFDQERKSKTRTALTFKEPASLFTQDDMFSGILKAGN
jgi:U3 small nucleolar RNA-associated protein 19